MKIIDKYIVKKFLGTFFYSLSLLLVIVVVFDLAEKIDDFLEKKATLHDIVFTYYFNFIPYFANLFSPLFTFIAVIFFTSKMASNTEIVAILNSGVSFYRMLFPYLISSIVICLLSLYLTNFVIPHANKARIDFEEKFVRNPFWNDDFHIHRQIGEGLYVYMETFNTLENAGSRFSMEKFVNGKLVSKLMSRGIRWNAENSQWQISNYFIRNIDGDKEAYTKGEVLDTLLNMLPADFGRKLINIETMNYSELNAFIGEEIKKGSDKIEFYLVEKYKRIAFPFATVILTFIAVAMSSRKVRGGIGMHIGIGLLISFSFILFMQVTTTFAVGGLLSPLISVWIPNVAYGFIGFYLLRAAPK